ncbi:hypothetical protein Taro_040675 [Colocasia esculenta]|uniref:DUF4283 domain-containing protein n=1 Tax=Colocasia esculenta TaxID=4460 RepID=A0A843WDT4_COLES|nr:hypothetical protein [Colocasia esculenta]
MLRRSLFIKGLLFRFFLWEPNFDFESDPTLIPVWVGFPLLPVNFYYDDFLMSIAGNLGQVLRVHESTNALTQTQEALVCVEIDIKKPRPSRIWIGCENEGFWQSINYHRVPSLCSFCRKLGHVEDECTKKHKKIINPPAPRADVVAAPAESLPVKPIWRQKTNAPPNIQLSTTNRFEALALDDHVEDQICVEQEFLPQVPVAEAPAISPASDCIRLATDNSNVHATVPQIPDSACNDDTLLHSPTTYEHPSSGRRLHQQKSVDSNKEINDESVHCIPPVDQNHMKTSAYASEDIDINSKRMQPTVAEQAAFDNFLMPAVSISKDGRLEPPGGVRTRSKAKAVDGPSGGVANPASRRHLRQLCRIHRPMFVAISEPMIPYHRADTLCKSRKMHVVAGSPYTWSNNRIGLAAVKAKLDRVLISSNWNSTLPNFSVIHLPRGPSDHAPLLLSLKKIDKPPARFVFQSMWTAHETFLDVVKNFWINTSSCWHPNPLVKLQSKLKSLKPVLKSWNFVTFGNVHNESKAAEEEMRAAEIAFDSSPSLSNRNRLHLAQAHVKSAQRCEDTFWCQKARTQWLDNGDKNTAFYHAVVQGNRHRNHISRLKVDGSNDWCEDQAALRDAAARFYEKLLTIEPVPPSFGVVSMVCRDATGFLGMSSNVPFKKVVLGFEAYGMYKLPWPLNTFGLYSTTLPFGPAMLVRSLSLFRVYRGRFLQALMLL